MTSDSEYNINKTSDEETKNEEEQNQTDQENSGNFENINENTSSSVKSRKSSLLEKQNTQNNESHDLLTDDNNYSSRGLENESTTDMVVQELNVQPSTDDTSEVIKTEERQQDEVEFVDSKFQEIQDDSSKRISEKSIGVEEKNKDHDTDEFSKAESNNLEEITKYDGDENKMSVTNQAYLVVTKDSNKSLENDPESELTTDTKNANIFNNEEEAMDKVTPITRIDSASTDHRSDSAISITDSDVYDNSIRIVNTQAQNTPNQEVVTVKFVADPNITFAHAFNLSSTIREIKKKISELIKLDTKLIKLSKDGYDVDDWLPLAGLGVEAFGCIELTLTSTDPTQKIIGIVDENVPTIDVITVHVLQDDSTYKDIIVEIHDEAYCKQWLGGYRNRKNLEYHHACTQTLPRARKVRVKLDNPPDTYEYFLFHRDTQTPYKPKPIQVDTPVNSATQMYRSDCMIPSKDDKIITAKEFESYDDWLEKNQVLEKIIKIQQFVREWLRRKHYSNLISIQQKVMEEIRNKKLQMLQEQVEKKRQMITGAAYPSKRDDFYMLYLMVGKWWQKEWQRIKDLRTEEPKKAEYCALLEKEITLLSAIEKHRIEVKKESLHKQEMRFLDMTSRPIIFRNANGGMISIDDPGIQKAREFKELYSTLISDQLSSKERIEFLLTLKNMLATYKEYEYAKDITMLIEREINLHIIGIKHTELKGIQKRIEQLFMYFLHQPQFNPKAAKYRKPNWPKTVDVLYKCTRCFKLLPVSGYPVHTRMEKIAICKSCEWLQNIGHQRIDMSPYLKLLKQIQNSEMHKCCYSSICFVLQQKGAYFLVNTIWHGHSAISESRDLSNLRLVRWIKDIEWSPWNNILLTEEEEKCHSSIENVLEFYEKSFIDSVRQKHILARVHFISLLKTDYHLRSTGAWENITDSGPYLHPNHIQAFIKQGKKF